jgi:hypothetical protein
MTVLAREGGNVLVKSEPPVPERVAEPFGIEVDFREVVAMANLRLVVSGNVFPLIRLHERDGRDYVFEPHEGKRIFMVSVTAASDDMETASNEVLRRLAYDLGDYAAFEVVERGRRDDERAQAQSVLE